MNIEVAKSDLEVALKNASLTVGSGSDLSSHYLFRHHEGQMEVLSYDMRVFSRAPFTATVEGGDGDAFTVEAWRLDKWIASVGDGVLTLTCDDQGQVTAKGPRSKIKLRSLDASRFPYWDGLMTQAEDVGDVPPSTLYRALNLTKHFVSSDDTSRPEICQAEASGGVLKATNRRAVSCVTMRDLPGLDLRIPGKDLTVVLKFLSDKTTQENDVAVKQASRPDGSGGGAASIFMRPDGSYVGVSRPTVAMPKLPVEVEESDVTLSLSVEEFNGAVDVLLAAAPKGHAAVSFSASDEGTLYLSMPSEAGGIDEYPMIQSTATGLNDTSFKMDYSYVGHIADMFDLDFVTFGVHERGRGGYVSFAYEDEGATEDSGNHYYTVIVWHS
ncbi:MAG: hypothetical protein CMJ67_10215 [Planctomycetaceae bacterium]|nr:hypothetical protein [Planctomycetaceae bacterium]